MHCLWTGCSHSNDPTLKHCLFGGVTLTKNADIDKCGYSGCGTEFDKKSVWKEVFHFMVVDLVKMH